ncbi:MAG TPA: MopE-related protein [Solirubrobacteraceae bacterium]|nr:MopE-related protein [Solirubrobacteraceae bacterium]
MVRRALVVMLALVAFPAAAQASTVQRVGDNINYVPSAGTADTFVMAQNGPNEVFFTAAPNLTPAPVNTFCAFNQQQTSIVCAAGGLVQVIIDLGDADDHAFIGGLGGGGAFGFPVDIDGKDGDDELRLGSENDFARGGIGDDILDGDLGNDTLAAGDGNDQLFGDAGNDRVLGFAGADELFPGSGADDVQGGDGTDIVFLTGGNETITLDDQPNDGLAGEGKNIRSDIEIIDAGSGADHVVGDANTNILRGNSGADTIDGAGGADSIEGDAGSDDLHGGLNVDQLIYPENAAQTITLDEVANDGQPNEGDNVHGDIESILAGPGNDTIVGDGGNSTLDGGDGNDELRGGGGVDTFLGGPGDDTILARDGLAETVDCGPGGGTATVDTTDVVSNCARVDRGDDQIEDLDGDGVDAPRDCNDRNAAIHPGARETVNNAVDENCDGRADFDRDLDGVLAPPAGQDCNDRNRRVRPGGREIPGNKVDENCDGKAAPFPRLESSVEALFITIGGDTRFTDFSVHRGRRGSKIRLLCSGPGCQWKARTVKVKRKRRTVNLMHQVRGLVLHPGARFQIRITKPQTIGGAIRFAIRSGKPPARRAGCLFPGRTRPRRCPG